MTAEQKIIEKIRKLLIADSTIQGYVKNRVYSTHISTQESPEFPAISLHILTVTPYFVNREFYIINVQIDFWMLKGKHDLSEILEMRERVSALLDRQDLRDSDLSLDIGVSEETNAGPVMGDLAKELIHYPIIYRFVAK